MKYLNCVEINFERAINVECLYATDVYINRYAPVQRIFLDDIFLT